MSSPAYQGNYLHLEELRTINSYPGTLANNFSGEDEVLEDLLVDTCERAATGTLLLDTGGAGGLAQHPTLGNEDDVAVRELLLEFPGQPADTKT